MSNSVYRVSIGGMLRCCHQSIAQYFADNGGDACKPEAGTHIPCKWCDDGGIVDHGNVIVPSWTKKQATP